MTKKDYELIADCLNTLTKSVVLQSNNKTVQVEAVQFIVNQTINKFARKLSEDNDKFDWDKFIEACNK